MVKAVVDVEKEIMAGDAERQSDQEALLFESGSRQKKSLGNKFVSWRKRGIIL